MRILSVKFLLLNTVNNSSSHTRSSSIILLSRSEEVKYNSRWTSITRIYCFSRFYDHTFLRQWKSRRISVPLLGPSWYFVLDPVLYYTPSIRFHLRPQDFTQWVSSYRREEHKIPVISFGKTSSRSTSCAVNPVRLSHCERHYGNLTTDIRFP